MKSLIDTASSLQLKFKPSDKMRKIAESQRLIDKALDEMQQHRYSNLNNSVEMPAKILPTMKLEEI